MLVSVSVSDPYSSNLDPDPAKNLNPDPDFKSGSRKPLNPVPDQDPTRHKQTVLIRFRTCPDPDPCKSKYGSARLAPRIISPGLLVKAPGQMTVQLRSDRHVVLLLPSSGVYRRVVWARARINPAHATAAILL